MFFRKKKRIKELENECEQLRLLRDNLDREKNDLKKRLDRAGSDQYEYIKSPKVKTIEIELEPVPYGTYCSLSPSDRIDEAIKVAKDQTIRNLAKGMVENNMVQFIVHDPERFDPLAQMYTVGAKLYVIPWEQMTTRVMKVRKRVPENDRV